MRLVCFPCAGSGPWLFRPWLANTGDGYPISKLVALGLPLARLTEADPFCAAIDEVSARVDMEGPKRIVLLGISVGGLVAFELARRMECLGVSVAHLVVVSLTAPSSLVAGNRRTTELSDAELLSDLAAMGGTGPEFFSNPELQNAMLPKIREHFALYSAYRYRPASKLRCPITLLAGRGDDRVIESAPQWAKETEAAFDTHYFTGDHFFFRDRWMEILAIVEGILPVHRVSSDPARVKS